MLILQNKSILIVYLLSNCLVFQACILNNFGTPWMMRVVSGSRDWQCFSCDNKQLWPHRAVAYFLLCRYEELKK